MNTWMKSMAAAITCMGLALSMQQARAACGLPDLKGMKPAAYFNNGGDLNGVKDAVYLSDGSGGALLQADFTPFHPFDTAAITGLWRFTLTSDGQSPAPAPPVNVLVDSGFATWHDDGTELMNSGRAPVSGSFCMGVWKQVGAQTYKLNHWALSWIPHYEPGQTNSWITNPDGSSVGGVDEAFQYFGPTNIQETLTLARDGSRYTGTFKLTQYVAAPASTEPPLGVDVTKNAGVAFVITGTVSATRISVD
ncbi:MAG TPA: hypothetical protein VHX52_02565 [Steroidobacteraceae bacterium]|nr:hypothetical protein [Steroidobacteraceae bacterium]